jgi:phosphoglycerate kinase
MPKFRTLDDIDVRGKRLLLRADLNIAMKNGVATDATRTGGSHPRSRSKGQ